MADRGDHESRSRKRNPPSVGADGMPTLPDAAFDFSAILSIADAIPVMIAYIDRQERYRFVNRALADWLEQPRSVILGKSVEDVLGSDAYRARKPMIDAAFAGEPQKFSREFE